MSSNRKHREIVTINVGGCGINLGQSTLEQYCAEQGISCDGSKEEKTNFDDSVHISFQEQSSGKFKARALFADLDPSTLVMTKQLYSYRELLNSDYLISGNSSADKNWARGHYTVGKELIDKMNEGVRLAVEECDHVQGFVINHSMHGGTGGGFGALLIERLSVDYRKKSRFGFHSLLAFGNDINVMSSYNTLLSLHWMLDHFDVSFMLDNQAIQELCTRKLKIQVPRYKDYNSLCNKVISGITAPFRFGMNTNLDGFAQGMILFPRLHFLNFSMSPIVRRRKQKPLIYREDINSLTNECVSKPNFFMHFGSDTQSEDQYMSLMFNYRSERVQQFRYDINATLKSVQDSGKVSVTKRAGFLAPSVQYIEGSPVALPGDEVVSASTQCVMIGNNCMFGQILADRFMKQFDATYSQRAYVHWYVGEGMDESEFAEAREDFGFLQNDFRNVSD